MFNLYGLLKTTDLVNNINSPFFSSRHSISGRSVATTPALSREDISNFASVPQQPKASFIEVVVINFISL